MIRMLIRRAPARFVLSTSVAWAECAPETWQDCAGKPWVDGDKMETPIGSIWWPNQLWGEGDEAGSTNWYTKPEVVLRRSPRPTRARSTSWRTRTLRRCLCSARASSCMRIPADARRRAARRQQDHLARRVHRDRDRPGRHAVRRPRPHRCVDRRRRRSQPDALLQRLRRVRVRDRHRPQEARHREAASDRRARHPARLRRRARRRDHEHRANAPAWTTSRPRSRSRAWPTSSSWRATPSCSAMAGRATGTIRPPSTPASRGSAWTWRAGSPRRSRPASPEATPGRPRIRSPTLTSLAARSACTSTCRPVTASSIRRTWRSSSSPTTASTCSPTSTAPMPISGATGSTGSPIAID